MKRRSWLGGRRWTSHDAAELFSLFYQLVRAFQNTFEFVIGASKPAGRLRASIWQSIFSADLRLYRKRLRSRMSDFATLITGPSGTGKEVVARAIALSQFYPFNGRMLGFDAVASPFLPINIAALTPTLVESELFGHTRGAFTGGDRRSRGVFGGLFGPGAVFLDELGEMSPEIQVKLLRVIETRQFQPVGGRSAKRFEGKLIAATNRDLSRAIADGQFRADLYYRLCADLIRTPSLAQQLVESPDDLYRLVAYFCRRVLGGDESTVVDEIYGWIGRELGSHSWPGNYRELEQCVRNFMIRKRYDPLPRVEEPGERAWIGQARAGVLSADELLIHYCKLVYQQAGSYEEAGRRLGLDRRTVKARVES